MDQKHEQNQGEKSLDSAPLKHTKADSSWAPVAVI